MAGVLQSGHGRRQSAELFLKGMGMVKLVTLVSALALAVPALCRGQAPPLPHASRLIEPN